MKQSDIDRSAPSEIVWLDWFVVHTKGKFQPRIKIKPTATQVHGGAGSVSQMVSGVNGRDYQVSKIDQVQVLRFSKNYAQNNHILTKIGLTLKEYQHTKNSDPQQGSLEEWI